ncbi:MAG: ABC-2 family transporter protein [Candidatus Firestonebacteria bacterium]
MKEIYSAIRCFTALQSINIKNALSYVANFWIDMLIFAIDQCSGLIFLWIIFTRVNTINGWSLSEIVFLYGMLVLSLSLYRLFFQGVRDTGSLILNGGLDQYLTKPRNTLFLMSIRRSNINGLGDFITGLCLIILAGHYMNYEWGLFKVILLAVFIISGNIIMIAIMMIQATVCFWIIRFTVLHNIIMTLRQFCQYPLTIYSRVIRILLYTIIPFAFVSYIPSAIILGKDNISKWWIISPPLAAILCITFAISFFHIGIRFYESTGS